FHHASHHCLSTFRRQRRILVDVHLVSPSKTEASQPQLPRFRPDGQPPERSHLATATRGLVTRKLDPSVGGSGPHAVALRPAPFVGALSALSIPASTASRFYVRDDRDTPLCAEAGCA